MWYIFDENKKILSKCNSQPNPDYLPNNAIALESIKDIGIERVGLNDNHQVIEVSHTPVDFVNQQITKLNAEYTYQLQQNDIAYLIALRKNDTILIAELNEERTMLETEYKAALEGINGGN